MFRCRQIDPPARALRSDNVVPSLLFDCSAGGGGNNHTDTFLYLFVFTHST